MAFLFYLLYLCLGKKSAIIKEAVNARFRCSQLGGLMNKTAVDMTGEVRTRISEIVENLIQSKSIFQKFDPDEMSKMLSDGMLETWSPEQVMEIPDDELTDIMKDIMVFKAMSGLLADLTPEEMEIFDAAVAGR